MVFLCILVVSFFFQAEDGIRDLVRSRGLGDVYKRQVPDNSILREFIGDSILRDFKLWQHQNGQELQ